MTDDSLYTYRASLVKVVDGDTVDLDVSLGFYLTMQRRFRLLGIDAPEMRVADPAGAQAKVALTQLISSASADGRLRIQTVRDTADKYGRYLASLYIVDTTGSVVLDVNAAMVKGGYATAASS